mmetsp:Transcript_11489/g.19095  ORF Transcript_11489/g.19095 Transcript_11489/m.19095 type:complete len:222 (+) Transcript_11489:211-876(+)
MLVVSSSVRMLNWILGDTSDLRPAVTLDSILVVSTSSLQERLVGTSSSSDDTNLGTNTRWDSLLTTGWQSKTGSSLVFIVGNDDGKRSGTTGESTTVTDLSLDIAHNGSLRYAVQRQDVSDGQSSLFSAVDELTSVHTLGTEKKLSITLVTVSIHKLNLGDWCSPTWVVHNLLDNTADVSMLFSIVQTAELHSTLARSHVGLEDARLTLSLSLNVLSHGER